MKITKSEAGGLHQLIAGAGDLSVGYKGHFDSKDFELYITASDDADNICLTLSKKEVDLLATVINESGLEEAAQ